MQTAAVQYRILPMTLADIQQVMEVEQQSFPTMWPQPAFTHELQQNQLSHYLVAVEAHHPGEARKATPEPMPTEIKPEGGALSRFMGELRHKLGGDERKSSPVPGEQP